MKSITLLVSMLLITGCSATLPEWTGYKDPYTYGYKKDDPCIRCGEGWTFVPPSAQTQ
jgi:hypothetical protein